MSRVLALSALALFVGVWPSGCCHCSNPPSPLPGRHIVAKGPGKYAILASVLQTEAEAETAPPGQKGNSEFWHDLVLTYCALVDNGYTADNIIVLYGDGHDTESQIPGYHPPYCDGSAKIADLPVNDRDRRIVKDNVCNVVCCVAAGRPAVRSGSACRCAEPGEGATPSFSCGAHGLPLLEAGDSLFFWIKGHGQIDGDETSVWFYDDYGLTDTEFAGLLKGLAPRRRVFAMETCGSRKWLDTLTGSGDVIMAAVGGSDPETDGTTAFEKEYTEVATAAGGTVLFSAWHGRFSYWAASALRRPVVPAATGDANAPPNTPVSVRQAFDKIHDGVKAENSQPDSDGSQEPALGDVGAVAPCIFLRLPEPGQDAAVLGMDNERIDATVPPGAERWDCRWAWEIRDALTGTEPERQADRYPALKPDRAYTVSVRVFNAGSDDPSPLTVTFRLAAAARANADDGYNFGTTTLESLPVAAARQSPPVPLDLPSLRREGRVNPGGEYCLTAELDATGDLASVSQKVSSDKNKVQITVHIRPSGP